MTGVSASTVGAGPAEVVGLAALSSEPPQPSSADDTITTTAADITRDRRVTAQILAQTDVTAGDETLPVCPRATRFRGVEVGRRG
jgi:hypothetical protein